MKKRRKLFRRHEAALVVMVLAVTLFFAYADDIDFTGKAISGSLPDWAASWAGVPWDVTNPSDTLVGAEFSGGKAVITAKGTYVYRTGYVWNPSKANDDGSIGGWQSFHFPQNSQYEGWATGDVSAEIPLSSDEILNGSNYVLAYTCQWKNNKWYCGCLNENTCGRWQLQTFTAEKFDDSIVQDMGNYIKNPGSVPDLPARAAKMAAPDTSMAAEPKADFNGDGTINFDDFFLFKEAFGTSDAKFDMSKSGKVDFDDFFIFADNFGKGVNRIQEMDVPISLEPVTPPEGLKIISEALNDPQKLMELKQNIGIYVETEGFVENPKADFDDNGKINFNDYFMFADAFGKSEGQYGYDAKFDLSGNRKIDLDDFFIFADNFGKKVKVQVQISPLCKEVFPGKNNADDQNKINVVFVGMNIDKGAFIEKAREYSYSGLLDFEPFSSNRDKFNLWYVDETGTLSEEEIRAHNAYDKALDLSENCILPNKYINIMIDSDFRSFADFDLDMAFVSLKDWRAGYVLIHEFGHSFGKLGDEYLEQDNIFSSEDISFIPLNCKMLTINSCSQFCQGRLTIDDLKSIICRAHDPDVCQKISGACDWSWINNRCENKVNNCIQRDEELCSSIDSCIWMDKVHDYYKSQCIPVIYYDINIGTQCVDKTSCYQGCQYADLYRSSRNSIMNGRFGPSSEYDYLNTLILCSRIKEVTGNAGGICASADKVLINDEIIGKDDVFIRGETKTKAIKTVSVRVSAQVYGTDDVFVNYKYDSETTYKRIQLTKLGNEFVGSIPIGSETNFISYYYSAFKNGVEYKYPSDGRSITMQIYRISTTQWVPDKILDVKSPNGLDAAIFLAISYEGADSSGLFFDINDVNLDILDEVNRISKIVGRKPINYFLIIVTFGAISKETDIEINFEKNGRQDKINIYLPITDYTLTKDDSNEFFVATDGSTLWAWKNTQREIKINDKFDDAIKKADVARAAPST